MLQHKRYYLFLSFLVIFIAVFAKVSNAADRFQVLQFHPTLHDNGFTVTRTSGPIPHFNWHAGTVMTFSNRLLENRTGNFNVVDEAFTQHFLGGLSVAKCFDVAVDIPVTYYYNFTPPAGGVSDSSLDFNDIRVEGKLRIINPETHDFGIALVPFFTVPTGDASRFMGDSNLTGGLLLALDYPVIKDKLLAALNVGFDIHEGTNFENLRMSRSTIYYGAGLAFKPHAQWSTAVELSGQTPGPHPFAREEESPMEVLGTVAYRFKDSGFGVRAGGGTGVMSGAGAPRVRAFLGVSYSSF